MTQNEQTFQTSDRKVQTCIPSAIEMSVREVDWHRIFRGVKAIPKPTSRYQILSSFFYGVFASALVALIPLYQTELQIEGWVKHATLIIGGVSLCIGFLLQHFSKKHEGFIEVNCESVKKDMKDIYETFFPEKDLEAESE